MSRTGVAFLKIKSVSFEDEGTYKCDVTYVHGQCPSLTYTKLTALGKSRVSSPFLHVVPHFAFLPPPFRVNNFKSCKHFRKQEFAENIENFSVLVCKYSRGMFCFCTFRFGFAKVEGEILELEKRGEFARKVTSLRVLYVVVRFEKSSLLFASFKNALQVCTLRAASSLQNLSVELSNCSLKNP